jgi:hypothetical protein
MGVLRRTLQGRVVILRYRGLKRGANLLPARLKIVSTGTAETVLSEVRGAEASEAEKPALFIRT